MRAITTTKKFIILLLAFLWICTSNAQKTAPSATIFEVDGTTYTWEVLDENLLALIILDLLKISLSCPATSALDV